LPEEDVRNAMMLLLAVQPGPEGLRAYTASEFDLVVRRLNAARQKLERARRQERPYRR
jgi:hypothetical protein